MSSCGLSLDPAHSPVLWDPQRDTHCAQFRRPEAEVRVSGGWFLLGPLSSAYRWPPSPVSLHAFPSACVCVPVVSSCEDRSQIGLGPTWMASLDLDYLFKGPVSKCSHILRPWELGFQHEFGYTQPRTGPKYAFLANAPMTLMPLGLEPPFQKHC